jgi:hypothetical protein
MFFIERLQRDFPDTKFEVKDDALYIDGDANFIHYREIGLPIPSFTDVKYLDELYEELKKKIEQVIFDKSCKNGSYKFKEDIEFKVYTDSVGQFSYFKIFFKDKKIFFIVKDIISVQWDYLGKNVDIHSENCQGKIELVFKDFDDAKYVYMRLLDGLFHGELQ